MNFFICLFCPFFLFLFGFLALEKRSRYVLKLDKISQTEENSQIFGLYCETCRCFSPFSFPDRGILNTPAGETDDVPADFAGCFSVEKLPSA
jgi:hypothetical protein